LLVSRQLAYAFIHTRLLFAIADSGSIAAPSSLSLGWLLSGAYQPLGDTISKIGDLSVCFFPKALPCRLYRNRLVTARSGQRTRTS